MHQFLKLTISLFPSPSTHQSYINDLNPTHEFLLAYRPLSSLPFLTQTHINLILMNWILHVHFFKLMISLSSFPFLTHAQLPDKTIAQLVKYYYLWKKTRQRSSLIDRHARKHTAKLQVTLTFLDHLTNFVTFVLFRFSCLFLLFSFYVFVLVFISCLLSVLFLSFLFILSFFHIFFIIFSVYVCLPFYPS